MKGEVLRKWILKKSCEIIATPVDLILFTLFMLGEAGLHPEAAHSFTLLHGRFSQLWLEGKDRIIRNAIYKARNKNWIKKDWKLTLEGKKRLENILPSFLPQKHWDKKWYLVIFDIPEKIKRKRDILRENLKLLGFGQLQASVWISPINYLKNIEQLIKDYDIESYVILSETDKLGKENSQLLANRIWQLEKINNKYAEFISNWKKANKSEFFWLNLKYYSILKEDPQLPKELLPEDWHGEKAHQLISKGPIKFKLIEDLKQNI